MTEVTRERLGSGMEASAGPSLAGDVLGSGLFRMSPRDAAGVRRKPGPVPEGWSRTPPSLLRYADEQTVAGTAAVFAAMAAMGAAPADFEGWGVVAASRYLGRASLAGALRSFDAEGVWGISPHLIPHFALHAPAGTISLALGLHGPNLGAGGGLRAAAEGVLAALTWLAAGTVPGVWLVLTGWSPELVPDRPGVARAEGECHALAIALAATARGARTSRPAIRALIGEPTAPAPADVPLDLVSLSEGLLRCDGPLSRTIATDASGRLRVELVARSHREG